MRLERVEPEHVLARRSGRKLAGRSSSRRRGVDAAHQSNRFRLPSLVSRIGMLPMEPGSLVMERKMLNGIKQRAEQLARQAG